MSLIEFNLPSTIARALNIPQKTPKRQQIRVLKKLLKKARYTEFGQKYKFDDILLSRHPGKKFQQLVPTYDYSKIHKEWWHRTLDGVPDVCWPGKIKYFALSSGTSEAASKYIPVTSDLMRGNRMVMIKQLLSLRNYEDIPWKNVGRGFLMLGEVRICREDQAIMQGIFQELPPRKRPCGFRPFINPAKPLPGRKTGTRSWIKLWKRHPIGISVSSPVCLPGYRCVWR